MSQILRNTISSGGGYSSLYPTLGQQRRPQTFHLRDIWPSGTRTWMHCTSSLFPSGDFMAKAPSSLVQLPSHLTICLYAKRSAHPDILIGTHEMPIPLASQISSFVENVFSFHQLNISRADIPCVLGNGARGAALSTQPVTLHLTVNITTTRLGRIQPPAPENPLPLPDRQPETDNTMPQTRGEMLPTNNENPRFALDRTDEVAERIVPIDRSRMWEGAVGRIKWVIDTLSPVAEVRVMPFSCLLPN